MPKLSIEDTIAPQEPVTGLEIREVTEKKCLGFSSTIGGYKLGNGLGHGASGVVKRATDSKHNAVAIKVFVVNDPESPKQGKPKGIARPRIENEISCLMRCQGHPNVLEVHECMRSSDKYYLVTEMAYMDLFDFIFAKGRLSVPLAKVLFRQLLSAVAHMHNAGIGHRDIKPENLLLTEDMTVKLCDFGYAASWKTGRSKLPGTMGTVRCLPPEMIRRKGAPMPTHDPFMADLWSCGIVLHFMLTGCFPFEADTDCQTLNNILGLNFRKRHKALTDDAWDFIQRMLRLEPTERATPEELLKDPFLQARRPSQSM